jgi:acyl-CoA thioester hydrolase
MQEPFTVRRAVADHEIDQLGHVNHAVYHKYGEYARLEFMKSAGCPLSRLVEAGMGIVILESRVRFLSELCRDDTVQVTCDTVFGPGKTFRMDSKISKADGTMAADIECVMGLLDLDGRRLVPDPWRRLREFASRPELLVRRERLAPVQ